MIDLVIIISIITVNLIFYFMMKNVCEEVIYSVDREISMLHRKISLINNINFVQKVDKMKTLEFKPYLLEPLRSMKKNLKISASCQEVCYYNSIKIKRC